MVVVPVILSMQEILNNEGEQQLMDVYDAYIDAAERALEDAIDAAIYSDGSANGGKQITGLATAVPIVTTAATTAASTATWRRSGRPRPTTRRPRCLRSAPRSTLRPFVRLLNYVMTKQSRGKDYADLLIMSPEHYAAYDAATVAQQRHHQRHLAGQIGVLVRWSISEVESARRLYWTAASAVICRRIQRSASTPTRLRMRYHPDRNFDKLFEGDGQMPIDKDAVAQFIGFMGELTMTNPHVQLAVVR